MKNLKPFIILLSLSLTVCACEEEKEFELKPGDIFNINNDCATIAYHSTIGNDSASAVDSIKRFYAQTRPDLLADSIYPQRLNVDFPYDNRLFWILLVRAKEVYIEPLFFWLDVVDSKGNRYRYGACDQIE